MSDIEAFVGAWRGNSAGESATAQQHYLELCRALGVAGPTPQEHEDETYRFEKSVKVHATQGRAASTEKIDVYKEGHFIWENKQGTGEKAKHKGHGKRGSKPWHVAMRKAFNQARRYAVQLSVDAPPFLIVCDIGHHIEVWSDFSGSGKHYDKRPSKRFTYDDLLSEPVRNYLRKVLTNPAALDPSVYQEEATRQIAKGLATVAKALEGSGYGAEEVSRFLMRCIFTMFAEDVELLPKRSFTKLLDELKHDPEELPKHLGHLWSAMNESDFITGLGKIRRFNGGLFSDPVALPLTSEQAEKLHNAAQHDWSQVEPAIFGTLVERALDEVERDRLGAHFTPRPFIERLVRPTVIEPLRDDWLAVEAEAFAVLGDEDDPSPTATKKAIKLVKAFHRKLMKLRVLDPACGTGNFLYVTYDLLKDLETEVRRRLEDLGDKQLGLQVVETIMPTQMLGIEKNPRAREIADIVLWIGHLQRLRRDAASETIPEPILQESDHIECRDAVLEWDGDPVPRKDKQGNVVTVWDTRTMKDDPVTGRKIPNEDARVVVYEYPKARPAEWPRADFIVSNPPFVGAGPMRATLGNGYVEALRRAWPQVPNSADFVMHWWDRAAELTRSGKCRRFGMITTNSVGQSFQRRVLERHLHGKNAVSILYAIPDHPWTTGDGAADVRIAMTVGEAGHSPGTLARVVHEAFDDDTTRVDLEEEHGFIHANLRIGVDVGAAVKLRSNGSLASRGVNLHGSGFIVTREEAERLGLGKIADLERHILDYRNGRDLTQVPREVMVIDLFGLTAEEVHAKYPAVYQRVVQTVKPERDENRRASRRDRWWLFGEASLTMRAAIRELSRYIVTVETSKHRFFQFLDKGILPDNMLVAIGLADGEHLAVLSSRVHTVWALAAGGRLGVGNDPRYNKTKCFDTFPFPDFGERKALRNRLAVAGDRLDTHRKEVQALGKIAGKDPHLTNQYNALERYREAKSGGDPLTEKEREFHEGALVGVLASIHEEIDTAVLEAYGWPGDLSDEDILGRVVQLNHERAAEEAEDHVRWLRPEFQAPGEKKESTQGVLAGTSTTSVIPPAARVSWPKESSARLLAVRDALRSANRPLSVDSLAKRFKGARKTAIHAALQSLVELGVVLQDEAGDFSEASSSLP